ncbi:hypothetical protein NQ315_005296 [Exocentrus adspersus]|uniref:Uncharacterized protein n=1 Tax=Exocentrus adspersus TaxID=1586481 RepID=A0AAV8W1Q8_9CUCU|nr:hypothetical protein NQ315_005296 [Exocentrus adspersus]
MGNVPTPIIHSPDRGVIWWSLRVTPYVTGGGGIVNQLKKSYSLSDLTDPAHTDETDVIITDTRLVRRRRSPHRSSSSTSTVYFSEVDVRADRIASIQSAEDISSGYSSGEGLYTAGQPLKLMAREGLQRTGSLTRSRSSRVTRSAVVKKGGGSDDSDENEVFDTNIVFFNDKPRKIGKLLEDPAESSSSEAEFLDTLDSLHDSKKIGEDLNIFNRNVNGKSSLLTACMDNQQQLDDVRNNTSRVPLPDSNKGQAGDNIVNVQNNMNILNITKDVQSFASFIQNLIDLKQTGNELNQASNDTPSLDAKDVTNAKPSTSEKIFHTPDSRGGKYNKKAAPQPPKQDPSHTDQSISPTSPIKATLILKPGVVRNLTSKESPCKEVFINSPKSKRKSLVNRSPSSVSTSSSSSLRSKHSFSKLMKLPKKIGFWNKDELSVPKKAEKRASWHCYYDESLKPLSDSKLQSKSDNDLVQNKTVTSLHGPPSMYQSGSQLSIKSLTDSPLARRRLKIIRTYVDDDID